MPRPAPAPALPPPRLMTAAEAAAYMRLPVRAFERLRLGVVSLGVAVRYDRHALDAHLDAVSGLGPQSPPAAGAPPPGADNDTPEDALARFQTRFAQQRQG